MKAAKNIRFTKPSKKVVQVYEMLKDGKPFSFDKMVSTLACSPTTAMVFICILRRDFGAEIETERDGRKVTAYILTNADVIASKMVIAPKATKVAKTKAPKVVATKVSTKVAKTSAVEDGSVATIDDLSVTEIDDRELDDLKLQLGLA
jgi:L-ascorbate metabolism protein UlaG (beta-lactamase superfamily)